MYLAKLLGDDLERFVNSPPAMMLSGLVEGDSI
jgi:hypothetical protein